MPRLVIPRLRMPDIGRLHWTPRWGWSRRGSYEAWLAASWDRIRAIPAAPGADRKRRVIPVAHLQPGQAFRLVDGHGRAFGRRHTAPTDLAPRTRVRPADIQGETLHSRVSRMLRAAHRHAIRED